MAFGWLAFYALVVFGLGLDGQWSAGGRNGAGREPGLGLAMTLALAISYVHRHYTFLLVYGDRETFDSRRTAFIWTPAIVFVIAAFAMRLSQGWKIPVPFVEASVSPWMVVLVITGAWNMWHTLMQRHGIARVYAGRAGAGLSTPEHGKRDKRLLFASALFTAAFVLVMRGETFSGIGNARKLLAALSWLTEGVGAIAALGLTGAVLAWCAWDWGKHEFAAELRWRERVPRLSFLASTACLLGVFWVHGPVIGYLCFGTAHAIEYVFFLHHFGRRKFAGEGKTGFVATMLRKPAASAPLIAGGLLGVFWLLTDYRSDEVYLVYYTATSLLHFLFDGWIWKVRQPRVKRTLGLR